MTDERPHERGLPLSRTQKVVRRETAALRDAGEALAEWAEEAIIVARQYIDGDASSGNLENALLELEAAIAQARAAGKPND